MAIFKKKKNQSDTYENSVRRIIEKEKPILGIDIGSSSIKIVSMKKNHELDKWALEYVPIGMLNGGNIEAKEPLADIIKNALKTYKIKTKDCALYLSAKDLIVRELTFPEMGDYQIRENIKQEISSVLPQDRDEYYIDYKILEYIKEDASLDGQIRVLAVAVPEKLVYDYMDVLKRAGLRVKYIDVLPNIAGKLCNMVHKDRPEDKARNICMIDFGSKKTEIVIFKDCNYYLHKLITYGGDYLTEVISERSAMDEIDAEDYKCKTNFFEGDQEDTIVRAVYEYFDYLLRDFARTIEFYGNRTGESIDLIYIMGGGALLAGFLQHIEDQLGIKVKQAGDIIGSIAKVGETGALDKHASVLIQAIGVTLREEWKHER
jgi:type IV pilus assembly protein PilM